MILRLAQLLLLLSCGGFFLGCLALVIAAQPQSWADLSDAFRWYIASSWKAWFLLLPLIVLFGLLTIAISVMSICGHSETGEDEKEESSEQQKKEKQLARRVRRALGLQIQRKEPKLERVLDALMGAPIDAGARTLTMIPDREIVLVEVVFTSRSYPVASIPRSLYQQLLERLRRMAHIKTAGQGKVTFYYSSMAQQIGIIIKENQEAGFSTCFQFGEAAEQINHQSLEDNMRISAIFRIEPTLLDIRTGEIPIPKIRDDQTDQTSGLITGQDPSGEHEIGPLVKPKRARVIKPLEAKMRLGLGAVMLILVLFFFWRAFGLGLCTAAKTACGPSWKTVVLRIRSTPVRGQITIQGHEKGKTPLTTSLPCRGKPVEVRVEAKGYTTWQWSGFCPQVGTLDLVAPLKTLPSREYK